MHFLFLFLCCFFSLCEGCIIHQASFQAAWRYIDCCCGSLSKERFEEILQDDVRLFHQTNREPAFSLQGRDLVTELFNQYIFENSSNIDLVSATVGNTENGLEIKLWVREDKLNDGILKRFDFQECTLLQFSDVEPGKITSIHTKVKRMNLLQGIEVVYGPPTAVEFVALRAMTGLPERKVSSAEKGIPNSLFWITLRKSGKLIGMGRVVGDGGTVVQITDIAVDPEHQGKGYGSFIFDQIREFILTEIPNDAFVCLFSAKGVVPFYQSRGFNLLGEEYPGMYWPCEDR